MLRVAKFIIGWPISLIALFFIGKIIFPHFQKITQNLQTINLPLLGLGISCFVLYFFLRTLAWQKILKEQGYDMPLKTVSYLWEISELKRYAPLKIWSFLGRSAIFGQEGIPTKIVLKSIFIEIQFLLLGFLIISSLAIPFVLANLITVFTNNVLTTVGWYLLVFSIILFYIFVKTFTSYFKLAPLNVVKRVLPLFSASTNASLILISATYAFLFGTGAFFSLISIAYVSPSLAIQIIGFLALSFLLSYLSFVTPMGLGVREGIVTIGLSKIMPLAMAGFASVFLRVMSILSEFIFLFIIFVWKNSKYKIFLAIEGFVKAYKQETALIIFVGLYILYFTTASFLRYDNFYTGRFDLGNMDQAVWNTAKGRIFELTDPNGTQNLSRLAFHADFILILLAPFYLLWEDPRMLLLIQTVVLTLGSGFVYAIAKNILKNKNLALTFGFLFLINPLIHFTNLYDFHAITLATTTLLAAFYFFIKQKYFLLVIFLILSGITKEQVWVIASFFGFPLLLKKETTLKLLGIGIIFFSLVIFGYLIWFAIPQSLGKQHFALSYYSDFGNSPTEVIQNVLLSPQKIISTIIQGGRLDYLKQIFMPLGFLSFISPLYLIFSVPDLLINLLSNNSQLHQIYYQYTAAITPFIFISAIFGIKNLKKWFPKIPQVVYTLYIILTTFYSMYTFGPLPFAKKPNIAMFTRQLKDAKLIDNFLSTIPPKFSVAATNNVGSHLSQRQKIYTIPVGLDKADYVVFLLNDSSAKPSLSAQKEIANKLKKNRNYIEVIRLGDFVTFKKRDIN